MVEKDVCLLMICKWHARCALKDQTSAIEGMMRGKFPLHPLPPTLPQMMICSAQKTHSSCGVRLQKVEEYERGTKTNPLGLEVHTTHHETEQIVQDTNLLASQRAAMGGLY